MRIKVSPIRTRIASLADLTFEDTVEDAARAMHELGWRSRDWDGSAVRLELHDATDSLIVFRSFIGTDAEIKALWNAMMRRIENA
jgi:hypothetical protein